MKVEIWSDVVCPWCYIGKRRFERALDGFQDSSKVEVVWRSFELDPRAPKIRGGDPVEGLARKYGITRDQATEAQARLTTLAGEEGLDLHLDQARSGNTFDAHRLLHLARKSGLQGALKERMLAAYFGEGRSIGDPDTLVSLAGDVGIASEEVSEVLDGEAFGAEVRSDETEAEELGVTGVPFFLFDRKYMIPGAQPVEVFATTLAKALIATNPT
ncbi:MAG: DsbA family oxidoreductase [Acidimicrobiales bacterium]